MAEERNPDFDKWEVNYTQKWTWTWHTPLTDWLTDDILYSYNTDTTLPV